MFINIAGTLAAEKLKEIAFSTMMINDIKKNKP
jgi:hypothetical protein